MPTPRKGALKSRLQEETRRREDLEARLQALEASSSPGPAEGIAEGPSTMSQDAQESSSNVLLSTVLQQQQAFQEVITRLMDRLPSTVAPGPSTSSSHGAAKRMDVPTLKSPTSITLSAFRDWRERFFGYVEATRLRHDCNLLARRSILRSALHEDWSQLWTGGVLAVEDNDDIDSIVDKLAIYLRRQRNPLLDRRDFHQRNQQDGESIDHYLAALRLIERRAVEATLDPWSAENRLVLAQKVAKFGGFLLISRCSF